MTAILGKLSIQDVATGERKTLDQITDFVIGKTVDQLFEAALSDVKFEFTPGPWRRRDSRGWRRHVRRMKQSRRRGRK